MSFIKKILFLILILGAVCISLGAFADYDIKVIIDDKVLDTDVPPVIVNDRTLVPLRAIFEALGATVQWDASSETVTAKKDSSIIVLKINDRVATVNGKQQELDVPATVLNDRTMVPVRFIANSLGTYVEWDDLTQTVNIITPKVIVFGDKNLEKVIREKVGIPSGDIKNVDVRNISTLDASNAGIVDIEGIENLCSLTKLDLSGNNISTILSLQNLTKLVELNLNKNRISYIYYLKNLTRLHTLDLSSNKINDANVLTNLPDLKELRIQFNPLNNLSTFTKFSTGTKIYLLDSKYPISIMDTNSLNEYEQVIKKATEITDTVIKSKMTDLEKELALHDYLALNTKYDHESLVNLKSSDYCHSAYGALILNKAVCDGYAKAMEIMLNMVGIDCMTVTGFGYSYESRPLGHAWNIVKIDGNYYHLDVTSDDLDGSFGEMIHQFVNLSDKQIAFSHNWNRELYPKCLNDNKSYDELTKLLRTTIYTEDNIYKIASSNLYKIDPKTSKASKLVDDKVGEIQIINDWLYYINNSDQQRIYKVKTDGTNRTKINDEAVAHISVSNKFVYYISAQEKKLLRINADDILKIPLLVNTDDLTTNLFFVDDWLYYRVYNWQLSGNIKRVNEDSSIFQTIVNDTPAGFKEEDNVLSYNFGIYERVSDGYLYYINAYDNKIYRVKLDGKEKTKICDDSIDNFYIEVIDKYIYYQNAKDNKTYRINIDGTQRICLQ